MTQEEKAKAYDEALERARMWKDKSGMPKDKQGILDNIFPELDESKDERIRKKIIYLVKKSHEQGGYALHEYEADEMLAWLEKQHTDPYNDVGFDCYGHHWSMCARDNGVELWIDNKLVQHFGADIHFFDGKSALEAINEVKVDNSNSVNPTEHNESNNVWTLNDAIPGSVIVDKDGFICIYQEPSTKTFFHSFCYCGEDKFCPLKGSHKIKNCRPAIKQECDKLFSEMYKAGYEWDKEKLELKPLWNNIDEEYFTELFEHFCMSNKLVHEPYEINNWLRSVKQRIKRH